MTDDVFDAKAQRVIDSIDGPDWRRFCEMGDSAPVITAISAALRDAVKAEREACAKMADERAKALNSERDTIWSGYPSEEEIQKATRLANVAGELSDFAETLRSRMCPAAGHASDCAIHNEPAFPAGPCDCTGCASKT